MAAKFGFDADMVRRLADILVDTNLSEIEVEDNGARIFVSRRSNVVSHVDFPQHQMSANLAMHHHAPAANVVPIAVVPVSPSAHPGALKSPMVGTAYLSAEPGALPFVKVGDSVKEGQTLLIIEAMKVMNPIKASKTGVIEQIFVTDATAVEFDEVLMVIE